MILGLTGKNASGKGEIASYLRSKGFVYLSLSDVLRDEATKRKMEHTRDNLINLGNELRKRFGASYLAQQINDKINQQLQTYNKKNSIKKNENNKTKQHNQDYIKTNSMNIPNNDDENKKIEMNQNNNEKTEVNFVIDSIRSPYEAKELMKNKEFFLVGVEAPMELRFRRIQGRGRLGDAKTVDELRLQEQRENLNNASNQQLDETFKLAKRKIVNDGSLEDVHKKVEALLESLSH